MSAFQVDLSKTSLFSHRLCIMTSVDTMEEVLRRLGKFHKQFMKDFSWTENSERGKAKMGSFSFILMQQSPFEYFASWDFVQNNNECYT